MKLDVTKYIKKNEDRTLARYIWMLHSLAKVEKERMLETEK